MERVAKLVAVGTDLIAWEEIDAAPETVIIATILQIVARSRNSRSAEHKVSDECIGTIVQQPGTERGRHTKRGTHPLVAAIVTI